MLSHLLVAALILPPADTKIKSANGTTFWSQCSATCGPGYQERLHVYCNDTSKCDLCKNPSKIVPERRDCILRLCPGSCSPVALISGTQYSIPDGQLTASSYWQPEEKHGPQNSRLNHCEHIEGIACAWVPSGGEFKPFIQADLKRRFEVHQVAVQGRGDYSQSVQNFSLSFSTTAKRFINMDNNGQGFEGTYDQNTVRTHDIYPTVARYVRLIVITTGSYRGLRWEIYGCPLE